LSKHFLTPERAAKFRRVVARRQPNLTVILENVHDPHNIGAVLRSCDSVGIREIFVLYTESHLNEERLHLSKNTAAGALKWVDVHLYRDRAACFEHVRAGYDKILSTRLTDQAAEIYDLDLTASVALLFGNEHAGISAESHEFADGNFIIPQVGMVESLNISVACAVTLYEAFRQRRQKGFYGENPLLSEAEQAALFDAYAEKSRLSGRSKDIPPKK